MKSIVVVLGLLLVGVAGANAGPVGVSFDLFYSSLTPHGEWIPCDGAVYAWRPSGVTAGWRPYYDGRWVWTDDGWYWVSEEPWAWATYHYGRWYFDDFYGWVWIPGYDWAPAWVEWRYGGGCVGWAPLSPYAVFSIGFGIRYHTSWITPRFWWAFVDYGHICEPNIHRYVYRSENNTRYIGRTRPGGSVRYAGGRIVSRGPDRGYVEQRGNVRVERLEIRDVSDRSMDKLVRDAGRERVDVYRPRIEQDASLDRDARPERLRQADQRISLDVRNLDVRAHGVDRETGRDLRRSEEYRQRETRPEGMGMPRRSEPRDVRRGGDGSMDRREAAPPSRERRWEPQREPRRESERVQPRRDDTRSTPPAWKGRSSEVPRMDRAPAPRRDTPRGGKEGGSESRGGGRRK